MRAGLDALGRRGTVAALAALALLPLATLGRQSLGYDELFTVWVASGPPVAIVARASVDGFTPPLFYGLVAPLVRLDLPAEAPRVVSVLGGVLAAWGALRLACLLGGPRAGRVALVLTASSAYWAFFAHELRPYAALLACVLWTGLRFVRWWRTPGPRTAAALVGLALAASLLSYLGLALFPPLALAALVRRDGRLGALVAAGLALALATSVPGLVKASELASLDRLVREAAVGRIAEHRPVARLVLGGGLPPERTGPSLLAAAADGVGAAVLLAALLVAVLRRDGTLAVVLAAFVYAVLAVHVADALLGIGVTTRYLVLAWPPLLLAASLLVARAPSWSRALAGALVAVQLAGLARYLTDPACAREDWRGAMVFLAAATGPGETVAGFPWHHLAVAGSVYAPGLAVTGGFVGRPGEPVYLAAPGASFDGYDLAGRLVRVDEEAAAILDERAGAARLWLVGYGEPERQGDLVPIVEALRRSRRIARVVAFEGRDRIVLRALDRRPGGRVNPSRARARARREAAGSRATSRGP